MGIIFLLILIPLVVAFLMLGIKSDKIRGPIVIIAGIAIAAISIVFAITNFGGIVLKPFSASGGIEFFGHNFAVEALAEGINNAMLVIEIAMAVLIVYLALKHGKILAIVLTVLQISLLVWFELTRGHEIKVENYISVDNFSLIMILIIGIIGSMICIYSIGYMKDFTHHRSGEKDRRPFFFFVMFIFFASMFGVVISNNLVWMFFFWEVTTLCSFLLIGYTKTREAINNSFNAITMNLLGGLAFVFAIIVMGNYINLGNGGTLELSIILNHGVDYKNAVGAADPIVGLIATLLAFAGITKAAQMPFNSWLLGAMVAPTPTSALLHSSTMVKAGVFLIVKLAPVLGVNSLFDIGPGFFVTLVGAVTFVFASFAAISQSNAKRVLAYSTIANLGLIITCAGLGTAEAVWAAIMLIIFHAVTKALLFLCVGTVEHNVGSRDIEDMDGIFGRMPRLALFLIIGISAMFLAPFGMLISKWAALKTFVDSGDIWIILALVFGSAATLFYWTKWLGKMTAIVPDRISIEDKVHKSEWSVLGGLSLLTIAITITFPFFSKGVVVPYLGVAFSGVPEKTFEALSMDNMIIMIIMVVLIIVLALLFYGRTEKRIVPIYMSGTNAGDNLNYVGAMQKDVPIQLRNWYLKDVFPEKAMNRIGLIINCTVFAIVFGYMTYLSVALYQFLQGGVA